MRNCSGASPMPPDGSEMFDPLADWVSSTLAVVSTDVSLSAEVVLLLLVDLGVRLPTFYHCFKALP